MKIRKLLPLYYRTENNQHSLYYRYFGVYWECNPPIWWLPRIQVIKGAFRVGWLWFAVGFMYEGRE